MKRAFSLQLTCAIALLSYASAIIADEVNIPGEIYPPEWIGPSVIDDYAQRQAQSGGVTPLGWSATSNAGFAPDDGVSSAANLEGGCDLSGSPPKLGENFAGFRGVLPQGESLTGPPDTMGAVGRNHFMEVINNNVSVFRKCDGYVLSSESLASFFSGLGLQNYPFDPRVLFDHHSDRWIVVATDGENKIVLAVSLNENPTDGFFRTYFVASSGSDADAWPDFPTLGVNAQGIYISALMVGAERTIWAIDKGPLIAGSPTIGTITAWRGLTGTAYQPAHTYGTSGSEYIIGKWNQSELQDKQGQSPIKCSGHHRAAGPCGRRRGQKNRHENHAVGSFQFPEHSSLPRRLARETDLVSFLHLFFARCRGSSIAARDCGLGAQNWVCFRARP